MRIVLCHDQAVCFLPVYVDTCQFTCVTESLLLALGPRLSLFRAPVRPRETLDKPWLRLRREDSASYTDDLRWPFWCASAGRPAAAAALRQCSSVHAPGSAALHMSPKVQREQYRRHDARSLMAQCA